jgi:hypothetical protein
MRRSAGKLNKAGFDALGGYLVGDSHSVRFICGLPILVSAHAIDIRSRSIVRECYPKWINTSKKMQVVVEKQPFLVLKSPLQYIYLE